MLRRSALVFVMGVAALVAGGCSANKHPTVKELTVPEAVAAHQAGAVFVDANDEDFRKDHGKLPGAILLASYRKFDAKSVLPQNPDAPLIFYCSNRR